MEVFGVDSDENASKSAEIAQGPKRKGSFAHEKGTKFHERGGKRKGRFYKEGVGRGNGNCEFKIV